MQSVVHNSERAPLVILINEIRRLFEETTDVFKTVRVTHGVFQQTSCLIEKGQKFSAL